MLPGFVVLLVCQLLGEAAARLTGLPVPGPVLGMLLLLAGLVVSGGAEPVQTVADGLLRHLSLLFVPASVGVIAYLPVLTAQWRPVLAAVVGSAVLSIAVTGLAMQALAGAGQQRRSGAQS